MGYDNNNCGMHMVRRWYDNYDNPKYYDMLAKKEEEKRREKEARDKMIMENRQEFAKIAFDQEVRDIKRKGFSIIDTLYQNVAYIAYKDNVDLVHDIDEIDSFIKKHVKDYDKQSDLEKSMFYVGLLAWRLGVSAHELYVDNDEMIKNYFIHIIDEALKNGNYDRNTYYWGKYILIETMDSDLYFSKDDESGKYQIDISFNATRTDDENRGKRGFPESFNVVYEDSEELEQLYNRIQFYHFFMDKAEVDEDYYEIFLGKKDDRSLKAGESIYISAKDLEAHTGFVDALKKSIPGFDLSSDAEITGDIWMAIYDNIPMEDRLSHSLYTEAGNWVWKNTGDEKRVTFIGKK